MTQGERSALRVFSDTTPSLLDGVAAAMHWLTAGKSPYPSGYNDFSGVA